MNSERSYNFWILLSSCESIPTEDSLRVLKLQLPNVAQILQKECDNYTFQLESVNNVQYRIRCCVHLNTRTRNTVIRKPFEAKFPFLNTTIQVLYGTKAYENAQSELKEYKQRIDGPWNKTHQFVEEHKEIQDAKEGKEGKDEKERKEIQLMDDGAMILLKHIRCQPAATLHWIWPITSLDKNNHFLMHIQAVDWARRIRYETPSQLLWEVYKHKSSTYFIDFRWFHAPIGEEVYNAIQTVHSGVYEGRHRGKRFERYQSPPQIWCLANDIPLHDAFCSRNMNCWMVQHNFSIVNPFKWVESFNP